MIATLTFNLPDEKDAHTLAIKGIDFYCSLLEIQRLCRDRIKHQTKYSGIDDFAETVRNLIPDLEVVE